MTRQPTYPDLEEFLAEKDVSGAAPRTLEWYRDRLRAFLRDLGPRPTRQQALAWLGNWKRETSPSPPHYRGTVIAVRAYLRFCGVDLAIRLPPIPRKEGVALTTEEVQTLLRQPRRRTLLGSRDYAILSLLIDSGIRASELVVLQRQDIDLEKRQVVVTGKGGHQRVVPVGYRMSLALRAWYNRRPTGTELAFCQRSGAPLGRRTVHHIVRRHGQAAGLHVYPHKLRRTFATLWIRNGGDPFSLQRILGHTTMDMVQRYVALAASDLTRQHQRWGVLDSMSR